MHLVQLDSEGYCLRASKKLEESVKLTKLVRMLSQSVLMPE